MPTTKIDNEPIWTSQQALAVARDMWAHMPGTGQVFFGGADAVWHENFSKHHVGDLFGGMCLIAEEPMYRENGDRIARGIFYTFVETHRELRQRNELNVSKWCCERTHIGKYYAIYDLARVMSHNKGECWLSEHVTSNHCGISRDQARYGIQWLVDNGWLQVVVAPRHGKRGVYRPVKHSSWTAEHGWTACMKTHAQV